MANQASDSARALLGLHALEQVHAGAGAALGHVDLPIQRERHTAWPSIAASELKGILRDACREQVRRTNNLQDDPEEAPGADRTPRKTQTARNKANSDGRLVAAFGPPGDRAHEHAGALSVTDARTLAFPVKSARGVFAWITCPAALERLQRDAALVGLPTKAEQNKGDNQTTPAGFPTILPEVAGPEAISHAACGCWLDEDKQHLLLDELDFVRRLDHQSEQQTQQAAMIGSWIAQHCLPNAGKLGFDATRQRFERNLIIVSDDRFTYLVQKATVVSARIALDPDTKTVKGTALFYEEFLPAETLLYALVLASRSRSRQNSYSAANLMQFVDGVLQEAGCLQIGANETTGKGLCAVRLNLADSPTAGDRG